MKSTAKTLTLGLLVVSLISGCSKSSDQTEPVPPSPETPAATESAAPAPAAPAPPSPANIPKAPTPPALPTAPALPDAGQVISQLTSKLETSETTSSDPVLKDISGEISSRIKALGESVGNQEAVQNVLKQTVSALTNGKDAEAIAAYQQITAAKLSPEQMALAGNVKDVVSAFVVQRNFSSLTGAEGQVGELVGALRKGDTATALQTLQQVSANAQLTADQKSLLNSIATSAAPAVNNATEAIKNLNPFGK